jgi:hypothetical protein
MDEDELCGTSPSTHIMMWLDIPTQDIAMWVGIPRPGEL